MTAIEFYKYSATGNDFIIIDNRDNSVKLTKKQIVNCCRRREGIGADGVVYLLSDPRNDFRLQIFNADGSEAEMCGNASRAITHFAYHYLKIKDDTKFTFSTMNGQYNSEIVASGEIKVKMTELYDVGKITLSDLIYNQASLYLNTGVPHSVYQLATLENFDFESLAKTIRFNERFTAGTNVDFFEVVDKEKQKINLRVFERGVEAETLCCGTGVMACAVACRKFFNWIGEIQVNTKGGLMRALVDEELKDLYIQGPVTMVYKGNFHVESN